jgi:hypothetical protein
LKELVGEDLSGVTFVRDYLQLQFNPPPCLNVFARVTVRTAVEEASSGDDSFPRLLVGQINKFVQKVDVRAGRSLDLTFDDASVISISLRTEHYVCDEAIVCELKNHVTFVV